MRTKRRGIKASLVVFTVFISLLGIVSMAGAGYFGTASENLFYSNTNSATAIFYGTYALYLANYDYDASSFAYYAYSNMSSAASYSSTASSNAYYGYIYNYNGWGSAFNYYAYLYAYNDYYYKNQAKTYLYYAYIYNSINYAPSAISNIYLGDFFNGIASFLCTLGSVGGTY